MTSYFVYLEPNNRLFRIIFKIPRRNLRPDCLNEGNFFKKIAFIEKLANEVSGCQNTTKTKPFYNVIESNIYKTWLDELLVFNESYNIHLPRVEISDKLFHFRFYNIGLNMNWLSRSFRKFRNWKLARDLATSPWPGYLGLKKTKNVPYEQF